jgi:type III restriction enzyme
MYKLRNYQEKHIQELTDKVNNLLNTDYNKICVFKAPTGSGKTIMMADFIKRLVDNRADGKEIAFIWITVHKLHEQSKEKLEKYYEDTQTVTCSVFEDLQDKQIQDKEILFFNWQSINQEDNIYIREREDQNNLSEVIKNTKESGREIILIIDESHHTAGSEKSQELIKQIDPKVTVEVSATPRLSNVDIQVYVDLDEVKKEEMIKNFVMVNPRLGKERASTSDELIIKTALKKRLELKNDYEKEDSNVNPLVLIQLPDSKAGELDRKDEIVSMLHSRFGITTENGKLAIYLSDRENKVNLENIEKNDNEVEVLIFKQAIAVGWDCPRSSILVLFREWKQFEFSIQTIGRIMRMPELKWYENSELNNAYVYTNIADIHIAEEIVKDYITIYESERKNKIYDSVNLKSVYVKRKHEKTRLTSRFTDFFNDVSKEKDLLNKINLESPKIQTTILADGVINRLDRDQMVVGKNILLRNASPVDIQKSFESFTKDCSEGYATVHSSERIMRALYSFFEKNTNKIDMTEMQQIVLDPTNKDYFIEIINLAKDRFKEEIVEKVERETEELVWNVPESTEYTKIYEEKKYKKCVMEPVYVKKLISPEMRFMDFLDDKTNQVKWWFKNGESDKKYFAIKYKDPDDNELRGFYVDFIVRMKNGKIGLFDTKSGITTKVAKPKAEALAKYIKNNKNKNLFGGITIFKNNAWHYNDSENFELFEKDPASWKQLILR